MSKRRGKLKRKHKDKAPRPSSFQSSYQLDGAKSVPPWICPSCGVTVALAWMSQPDARMLLTLHEQHEHYDDVEETVDQASAPLRPLQDAPIVKAVAVPAPSGVTCEV